jgi:hypothetical protein
VVASVAEEFPRGAAEGRLGRFKSATEVSVPLSAERGKYALEVLSGESLGAGRLGTCSRRLEVATMSGPR